VLEEVEELVTVDDKVTAELNVWLAVLVLVTDRVGFAVPIVERVGVWDRVREAVFVAIGVTAAVND
jgi:hypothetical protein